jgi:CDP-glucose 4,6-dehydratase
MSFLRGFYAGKRVLVTGHTGFKGSWLALWLERLGAEVTGIALPSPTSLSLFSSSGLQTRVESKLLDIRHAKELRETVERCRPEIVFHLAAQPIVGLSYSDPATTFETNLMGTVNLLDAIRACPSVRVAIMVTSDKCYQNAEQVWGYREIDRLGGDDPYSASKACAEIAVAAYRRSYFDREGAARVASVRAGNVIGGGDWSDYRLVPDCIRALRAGAPIVLRSPGATRPWQFVLEPLAGYMLLASRLHADPVFAGAWNFGPAAEAENTVKHGAEEIVRLWGEGRVEVNEATRTFHETTLLYLDSSKSHRKLGWSAILDFGGALKTTVSWYKAQHTTGDGDMFAFTTQQIAEYEAALVARRPQVFE